MKNLICSIVFIVVYIVSVIMFYHLDFFYVKDCNGNSLNPDWGKILGYALIPSLFVMIISWMICNQNEIGNKKYRFDNQDSDFLGIESDFNYSCGMSDRGCGSKYNFGDIDTKIDYNLINSL